MFGVNNTIDVTCTDIGRKWDSRAGENGGRVYVSCEGEIAEILPKVTGLIAIIAKIRLNR